MDNKEEKQIKIVSGNGKNLDISTVYEHIKKDNELNDENNQNNKKKTIIIPKGESDTKKQ